MYEFIFRANDTRKAKPLYNRLVKYKENYLYFMKDFQVSFDDNLTEKRAFY